MNANRISCCNPIFSLVLTLIVVVVMTSACKEKGCTDFKALNYSSDAKKDDGSCRYTKFLFYQSSDHYTYDSGISKPISRIEVFIVNDKLGETEDIYESPPQNCSAFGAVPYKARNTELVDWNARIYLEDGMIEPATGTIKSKENVVCIPINVLNH